MCISIVAASVSSSCMIHVMIQLHCSCTPAVFQLRSSCTPAALQLYSSCIPVIIQLYFSCIPAVVQLYSSCTPVDRSHFYFRLRGTHAQRCGRSRSNHVGDQRTDQVTWLFCACIRLHFRCACAHQREVELTAVRWRVWL